MEAIPYIFGFVVVFGFMKLIKDGHFRPEVHKCTCNGFFNYNERTGEIEKPKCKIHKNNDNKTSV